MKFKSLLLTASLLMGGMYANAQTYGTWVTSTDPQPTFWDYSLTATAASHTSGASVSVSPTAGFLPFPPSGSARVYTPGSGGKFDLTGTALTSTATTGGSTAKFSAYGITGTTSVTSLFFDINFNSTTATNGNFILGIGKHAVGNVFDNTNNITTAASSPGVFGALQFAFFGGTNVQVLYRINTAGTFTYSVNNTTVIPNRTAGPTRVEIYCNNSNTLQKYTRGATTYDLPAQTYNVFIGGTALTYSSGTIVNLPATSEGIVAGEALDAFTFNPSSNTNPAANTLNFTLSNIKVGRIPLQVLPIKLDGFSGKVVNNSAVQLSFKTLSEHDNAYFDILRSANGSAFNLLGRVTGSGNSTETKNYSFTDFNPAIGTNYYKLRQIDRDGKSEEFDSIAIKFGLDNNSFNAYVNESKLTFKYNSEVETQADLTVLDLNGKKVIAKKITLNKGFNQPSVDVSYLPSGVYVLRFVENAKVNTVKFVKK